MSHAVGARLQGAPRRLVERLPPPAGLRLRAWKNYPRLHGLFAPAPAFCRLVPTAANAVDAGANRGIYAYWMARRARHVYAFEPLPRLSAYLRRADVDNVTAFDVALSDTRGDGTLWVPPIDGEASLVNHVGSEGARPVAVKLAPLDDFDLPDVGFLKIDVEGYELPVLRGAEETIRRCRPVVFVEIEQRYHPDMSVHDVFGHLSDRLAYRHGYTWRQGRLGPLSEFELARDQSPDAAGLSGAYINNFVFSDFPIS